MNVVKADVQRMGEWSIPAYVVGIDEPRKAGYILSMNEVREEGLGGIPMRHPLDCANLDRLRREVLAFWSGREKAMAESEFVRRGAR